MAFNKKLVFVFAIFGSASMLLSLAIGVAGADGESVATEQKQEAGSKSNSVKSKLPVLFVRDGANVQDLYLGWLDWESMSQFKPFLKPLQSNLGPYTQQMTEYVSRVPGAQNAITQINQAGDQFSGMVNPANLAGQLGSIGASNGNPLSGLMSQFSGRR